MLYKIIIVVLLPLAGAAMIVKLNQWISIPWLERLFLKLDAVLLNRHRSRKPIIECGIGVFILLFVLFVSMGFKSDAWWDDTHIAVICRSENYPAIETPLKEALEKEIRTPQKEKVFRIKHVDLNDFQRYIHFKYIIIPIAPGMVSEFEMKTGKTLPLEPSHLPGSGKMMAKIHIAREPWRKNQVVFFITGENWDDITNRISDYKKRLFSLIQGDVYSQQAQNLFLSTHEKKAARNLRDQFGWTLERQKGLLIWRDDLEEGLVTFKSWSPHHWMFVRWLEDADPENVDDKWIRQERNRITAAFYDSMTVAPHYFQSEETTFLGYRGWMTEGLWEMEKPAKGGPFKNYTFYDPSLQRLYMIDFAVFGAGKPKWPFLREMDIIAHTFISGYHESD